MRNLRHQWRVWEEVPYAGTMRPRYWNPPTQIFQSLKTTPTFRQERGAYADLPISFWSFAMMNSRSFSLRNFASSGKSGMTQNPTIDKIQVKIPSRMKTRGQFLDSEVNTPSPSAVSLDTVHFTDCAGQETTKGACQGRGAEEKCESFLCFRPFIPHGQQVETTLPLALLQKRQLRGTLRLHKGQGRISSPPDQQNQS